MACHLRILHDAGPKNHAAALLEGGLHDVLVLHQRVQ
jgi:hypothetical protein